MRIIASSFGSAGDFAPTVAAAAALARRGHDVCLVANPVYREQLGGCGLTFLPAGQTLDLQAAIRADAKLLDPWHGGRRMITDWLLPEIRASYQVTRAALAERSSNLFLGSTTSFGAYWAAAECGLPNALVAATALTWLNPRAPMALTPWRLPALFDQCLIWIARLVSSVVFGRILRRTAHALGVRGIDCSYHAPTRRAAVHLGMWSPAIRPPAPKDPPHSTVCGSARASAFAVPAELQPELKRFLETGAPPVVVAFGSVFSQGTSRLLIDFARAVLDHGERCLIVGHVPDPIEDPRLKVVPSAPYDALFPLARAVIVHGGAGSTAEALRSGRPVGVFPFGFDQYAQGRAVERLGSGIMFGRRDRTPTGLRAALARLLAEDKVAGARAVGEQMAHEPDGAEVAAQLIEQRCSPGVARFDLVE